MAGLQKYFNPPVSEFADYTVCKGHCTIDFAFDNRNLTIVYLCEVYYQLIVGNIIQWF